MTKNKTGDKTDTKTVYYGKGLVKFQTVGGKEYSMSPIRRNIQYSIKDDDVFASVSCNVIDSILWGEAKEWKEKSVFLNFEETTETYKKAIEENARIIAAVQLKLDEVSQRKEKAFRMYLNGGVSEEIYNSVVKEIDDDIDTYTKQIAKLESANASMQTQIEQYHNNQYLTQPMYEDITDDEERKKIIHSVVEKVVVSRIRRKGFNDKVRLYRIKVIPIDILKPIIDTDSYYEYYVSGGVFHLYYCLEGSNIKDDFTCWIEKRIKPYERKSN